MRRKTLDLPLLFTALAALSLLAFHGSMHRHFLPGGWMGRQGLLPFDFRLFLVAYGLGLVATALLIRARRRREAIALAFVAFVPCFSPWPNGDIGFRYHAERGSYHRAIETGRPFGDQFREVSDGRPLTYWRWMSWDLDNAVGIVYDPDDRLSQETDQGAFRQPSHGVIFQIRRLEPRWFYVVHS